MLTSAAEYNEALASRCPSARQSIRQLALFAGTRFLDLSADESDGSQLEALVQLIQVLQQHAGQAAWAASLSQATVSQLPGVLPSVLQMDSEVRLRLVWYQRSLSVAACISSTSPLSGLNLLPDLHAACWTCMKGRTNIGVASLDMLAQEVAHGHTDRLSKHDAQGHSDRHGTMYAGFCMHPQHSCLVQAGLAADSDTSPKALALEGLTACKALFAQLPWEDIAQLEAAVTRKDVQLPLILFLTTVAMQAEGNADATELMHSAMTVSGACCSVSSAPQETISLYLHWESGHRSSTDRH